MFYPKVSFWLCLDKNDYFATTNCVPWTSKIATDIFNMMWNKQLIVCGHNSAKYFINMTMNRHYTPWVLSRTGRNMNVRIWIDSVTDAVAFVNSNDIALKYRGEFTVSTEIIVIGGYKTFKAFIPLVDNIYVIKSNQFSSGYVHLADIIFPELARHFVLETNCPFDLDTDIQLYKRKRFVLSSDYTLYTAVEPTWKYEVSNRQLSAKLLNLVRFDDDGYKST